MSPAAVTVKLTEVPTVPVVGAAVKDRVSGEPVMLIDAEADAMAEVESVTFTLTVKDPFTL